MIRKAGIILFIASTTLGAYAQKNTKPQDKPKKVDEKLLTPEQKTYGVVFFDRTVHDFGRVEEAKGSITTSFSYRNVGGKPVKIKKVETSCGCTATDYSREEIAPGAMGKIDVRYDTKDRSGSFSKTVTVYTDGQPEYTTLTIKGDVIAIDQDLKVAYPFAQGNMRLSTNAPVIKKITDMSVDSVAVGIYNYHPTKSFEITSVKVPPHIKAYIPKKNVLPKSGTHIWLYYNAQLANDLGEKLDEITIGTTDDSIPSKRVIVKAYIEQDFEKIDPKIKKSPPKAVWTVMEHNFGEIYLGEKVTYDFVVANKGKSDLLIRKAKGSCGCTATNVKEPIVIKKGKKGKLSVTFDSSNQRGNQEKTIIVFQNDPANPVLMIKIKAKVIIPGQDK